MSAGFGPAGAQQVQAPAEAPATKPAEARPAAAVGAAPAKAPEVRLAPPKSSAEAQPTKPAETPRVATPADAQPKTTSATPAAKTAAPQPAATISAETPAKPDAPSPAAPETKTVADEAGAATTRAEGPPAEPRAEHADEAAPASAPGRSSAAPLPHDLSPTRMFLDADLVVKGVMISLMLASVAAWAIWFAKLVELGLLKRKLRRGLDFLDRVHSLVVVGRAEPPVNSPVGRLVASAREEIELSRAGTAEGIKERIAMRLAEFEAAAYRSMRGGTGILASIGATAPFVGLFGTVWGIMNSFIGISRAQTTNLAVVAPGIAEALLATAIGLIAAIPAVLFYNHLTRVIASNKALMREAGSKIERHVSRDLDRARPVAEPRSLKLAAE